MTRALRLEHPGVIWQLTSRGNERGDNFRSDRDRSRLFEIFADAIDLHSRFVSACGAKSHHYQLLIETPHPTLSVGANRGLSVAHRPASRVGPVRLQGWSDQVPVWLPAG
jgi:hypothetical protein